MAVMDRNGPHHVALPTYRCLGHNYLTMHFFCEQLSLSPRAHSLRQDGRDLTVFCFAERSDAEHFRKRFGGEFLHGNLEEYGNLRVLGSV